MNTLPTYSTKSRESFSHFLQLYSTIELAGINRESVIISKNTSEIKSGLDRAVTEIIAIGKAVNIGILAQLHQLEAQNKTLSAQLKELESINHALNNPEATKAKEWYIKAEDLLAKGLFDLSLDAFLTSLKIFPISHLTYLHIGKLYLLGLGEDCNIVNIEKAVDYIALAKRIAKSEVSNSNRILTSYVECCFYLAMAQYVSGNECLIRDSTDEAQAQFRLALKSFNEVLLLRPYFAEARYYYCKILILIGDIDQAKKECERLHKNKNEYVEKMIADDDFEPLHPFLETFSICPSDKNLSSFNGQGMTSSLFTQAFQKSLEKRNHDLRDIIETERATGFDCLGKCRLAQKSINTPGMSVNIIFFRNVANETITLDIVPQKLSHTESGLFLQGINKLSGELCKISMGTVSMICTQKVAIDTADGTPLDPTRIIPTQEMAMSICNHLINMKHLPLTINCLEVSQKQINGYTIEPISIIVKEGILTLSCLNLQTEKEQQIELLAIIGCQYLDDYAI